MPHENRATAIKDNAHNNIFLFCFKYFPLAYFCQIFVTFLSQFKFITRHCKKSSKIEHYSTFSDFIFRPIFHGIDVLLSIKDDCDTFRQNYCITKALFLSNKLVQKSKKKTDSDMSVYFFLSSNPSLVSMMIKPFCVISDLRLSASA